MSASFSAEAWGVPEDLKPLHWIVSSLLIALAGMARIMRSAMGEAGFDCGADAGHGPSILVTCMQFNSILTLDSDLCSRLCES